jgi:predicted RecA/RadA family phage recombinase
MAPKFKPGQAITRAATATIVGGQLVTVAGAVAVADSVTWLGVATKNASRPVTRSACTAAVCST